jgi:hypothetical protein
MFMFWGTTVPPCHIDAPVPHSPPPVPQVPYYEYALDMVLDNDPPADVVLTDEQHELLESAAEMLYGLVHARYIVTQRGLQAMLEKYKNCDFGRCPRVCCEGQPCLPVGTSDIPGLSTAKIFCPKCEDIFYPRNEYQCSIDGAYFGTTFPHLLFMTFPAYRPPKSKESYVPRVFGFKMHPTAYGTRRQLRAAGEGGAADQQRQPQPQQQQPQQQQQEPEKQVAPPQPTNGTARAK